MAISESTAPTMIIPQGTEIEVDAHGQLSIRAPGNLVIQNSGSYGKIESVSGSIRIDRDVDVEAVSVRCAADCYVQGNLTAWKVSAESLQLEDTARANIVLQETQRLQIGRDARLVGNFSSEKDLFGLFSRFARQVRELPFLLDKRSDAGELAAGSPPDEDGEPEHGEAEAEEYSSPRVIEARATSASEAAPAESAAEDDEEAEPTATSPADARPAAKAGARDRLPEPLYFARVLLERDAERKGYGTTSQRILEEIVKLLAERDLETLRHTYRTLFGRIVDPTEDARRAAGLVSEYFEGGG